MVELKEKLFPAKISQLDEAMVYISAETEAAGVPVRENLQIAIAFEEMFVNVAHYAYPGTEGSVKVGIHAGDGKVTIQLTDSGIPFNPLARKEPDITLSAEERQIGGLGIFMVMKSMDEVDYRYEEGHNVFTMVKNYGGII